jgi:hypothetical protein
MTNTARIQIPHSLTGTNSFIKDVACKTLQRNSKLATASKSSLHLIFAEFYVQHDKHYVSLFATDNLFKLK